MLIRNSVLNRFKMRKKQLRLWRVPVILASDPLTPISMGAQKHHQPLYK